MTFAETSVFATGQSVEWLYEARGGYGYQAWVLARVLKVGAKRVQIVPQFKDGSEDSPRWVTPARLRVRLSAANPPAQPEDTHQEQPR